MSNDMSEHTGAAIPDDVMAEAVEANVYRRLYEAFRWVSFGDWDVDPASVEAHAWFILDPIITDIEKALLTRIADDAHAKGMEYFDRNGLDTGAIEMFEREEWIRSFLPTEDEEAK